MWDRLGALENSLHILQRKENSNEVFNDVRSYTEHAAGSQSVVRVVLMPRVETRIPLTHDSDQRLWHLIRDHFPNLRAALECSACSYLFTPDIGRCRIDIVEPVTDEHTVWAGTSYGGVGVAAQALRRCPPMPRAWSLSDTLFYAVATIRTAHRWWQGAGYWGEAILRLSLNTQGEPVAYSQAEGFQSLRMEAPALRLPSLRFTEPQRRQGDVEVPLTYYGRTNGLPDTATNLLEALLRALGYSIPTNEIRSAVQPLVALDPTHAG